MDHRGLEGPGSSPRVCRAPTAHLSGVYRRHTGPVTNTGQYSFVGIQSTGCYPAGPRPSNVHAGNEPSQGSNSDPPITCFPAIFSGFFVS